MASVDALGLTLDDHDPSKSPCSTIIYGPPGSGKSSSMAHAFQNALFILSNRTVLDSYDSWYAPAKTKWEADPNNKGKPFPFKTHAQLAKKTLKTPDEMRAANTNTWQTVSIIVQAFIDASAQGTNPYEGLIFDEWPEICARIHEDMKTDPKFLNRNGKVNPFDVIDALKSYHRWIFTVPRVAGKMIGLVCHAQPPKYFDPDDETIPVDQRGKLQYKGGPTMPFGKLVEQVCAAAEVVLHLTVKDGIGAAQRVFYTQVDPLWERKVRRGFGLSAEVPLEKMDLRTLLLSAGYQSL